MTSTCAGTPLSCPPAWSGSGSSTTVRAPTSSSWCVPTAPPGKLPLERDGLTVDEDTPGLSHVDESEGLDIADRRTLALRLQPGHYVLFCNMEGHYLGGMHAAITVR